MSPAELIPWALVDRAMPPGHALQGTSIELTSNSWEPVLADSNGSWQMARAKQIRPAGIRIANMVEILQPNSENSD
jgi:hypothetical protein